MIINKLHGTYPILAHAPGKLDKVHCWNELLDLKNYSPLLTGPVDNLTIIVFNNGAAVGYNDKPMGLFESSLKSHHISHVVLGANISNWQNSMKIPLLSEGIKCVKTDYVLFVDSSDVFLLGQLKNLIPLFTESGCRAMFNAERIQWPSDLPAEVLQFERSLCVDRFLNGGVWLAQTSFVPEITSRCSKITPVTKHHQSEQVYYKYVLMDLYPEMQVDYQSRMFQCVNRTSNAEIEFVKFL